MDELTTAAEPSKRKLALGGAADCPSDFKCPISLEIMVDPVMLTQSGNTYERKMIMRSLAEYPRLDPLSGGTFEGEAKLAPNLTVKRLIAAWRDGQASKSDSPRAAAAPVRTVKAPRLSDAERAAEAAAPTAIVPRALAGHADYVFGVAFARCGRRVASRGGV